MTDPTAVEDRAQELRLDLAKQLEAEGFLRTPAWREAVEAVPRHVFLPFFYKDAPGPNGITRYTPVSREATGEEWMSLVYQNKTWVTQLDHGATHSSTGQPVIGTPTSSSTLPGVVVRMLEDLDVHDGMNVLEAGSGTLYSTALLCHRLGDRFVTSIEHDEVLSAQGRTRLAHLRHHPRLVTGDAAAGCPEAAPYERVIATYSPTHVPPAWLAQTAVGGQIVVSLTGSLDAYGYVRLTKTGEDRAEGRFINGEVSFMPSRESTREAVGPLVRAALSDREGAEPLSAAIDAVVLDDPALMWAAQIALPGTIRLTLTTDGVMGRWFLHPDGSWAVLETGEDDSVRAFQGGPGQLWSTLEATALDWVNNERPGLHRYGLTVTATETNTVWLDEPGNPVGTLSPL